MMLFEFNSEVQFKQTLELDDIGNFFLRCIDARQNEYYYASQTSFGKVKLIKYGPLFPDALGIDEKFSLEYKKVDYKETILTKELTKFLNDPYKGIVKAEEISIEDFSNSMPTVEYLMSWENF